MPVPIDLNIHASILHDVDANPIDAVVRSDGKRAIAVDALLSAASDVAVDGNIQIQHVETEAALGGLGSFTSTFRDCEKHEAYGVSAFLQRGANDTTLNIYVEHSKDGVANIREVENIPVSLTAAAPTFKLDRVYSVTRRYYRVRIVNNSANGLTTTDLIVTLKPIS